MAETIGGISGLTRKYLPVPQATDIGKYIKVDASGNPVYEAETPGGIVDEAGANAANSIGDAAGADTTAKLATFLPGGIEAGTATATPADTDVVPSVSAAHAVQKSTWAQIKAAIALYFNDGRSSLIKKITHNLLDSANFIAGYELVTTVLVAKPEDMNVNANTSVTNIIELTTGTAKTFATNLTGAYVLGYILQNGNYVRNDYINSSSFTTVGDHKEFTIGANTAKVRITFTTALNTNPIVVLASDWITASDSYIYLTAYAVSKYMPLIAAPVLPPFYNKKIAGIGDSIMTGYDNAGGFLLSLSQKYPLVTISNLGAGSTTFARNNNVPSNVTKKCIYDRMDDLPAEYDYYIVEGGLNDFFHRDTYSVLIGSYIENIWNTPRLAYYDGTYHNHELVYPYGSSEYVTLDVTTFCGAFEASLIKLITRFYDKKYGVIIPHDCRGDKLINTYMDIEIALCGKYGVPVLDLRKVAGMPHIYSVAGASDGTAEYTYDSVHPNYDGYRIRYLPAIEKWMETL